MKTNTRKPKANHDDTFERVNRNAATLVLADVQRFGGEDAALVLWARAVVEGGKPTNGQGRLF